MIRHEAPGMDLPAGFGAGFAKGLENEFAVFVAQKDGLATVAAIDKVVNGPQELDAELSGLVSASGKGEKCGSDSFTLIGPEEGQLFYIQKQVEKGLKPPPYQ